MTETEIFHCQGAPRDLGRAQGRRHCDAIRRVLAAEGLSTRRSRWPNWQPLASGPVLGRGSGREILRHYPHHGERLAGIALEAGVPLASLVAKNVREVYRDPALRFVTRCVRGNGGSVRLVRGLPNPPSADESWVLRRSVPEVGFGSVELTKPWFVSALAGINEHGLAVALSAPRVSHSATRLTATLLLQDCLQRFTTVAACVDWCSKRPSQGASRLVLADADGETAQVDPGGSDAAASTAEDVAPEHRGAELEVHLVPESRMLRLVSVPDAVEIASLTAAPVS